MPLGPIETSSSQDTARPAHEPVQPAHMHKSPIHGGTHIAPPQSEIPKSSKHVLVLSLGALLLIAAAVMLIWGFVAPAENPDVPPVAEDGELPVPD